MDCVRGCTDQDELVVHTLKELNLGVNLWGDELEEHDGLQCQSHFSSNSDTPNFKPFHTLKYLSSHTSFSVFQLVLSIARGCTRQNFEIMLFFFFDLEDLAHQI